LEASGSGHIVNIGSIAGFETYPGGAGYTSVKHAVRAISRTLRIELLGKPIRVTEIDPGLVETEFSVVRFSGDEERAAKVYEGMTPLTGDDIADCIAWAVTRPRHVNIDEMVVRPMAQATATQVARGVGL
jgi:NADP-dependent 3-hydroxy acid dehydrogenase YdfG